MATLFVPRLLVSAMVAATLGLTVAGLSGPGVRTAHACSFIRPHEAAMAATVERSPIVAIGRWEAVSEREVTFVVEQPLKGAEAGDRLPVDNRTTYTAMACSPYDEPFREGHRFIPGERAVLLLEKEVDGLWQVAYLALAVFEVPGSLDDSLQGMGWYFGDPEAGTPTDIKLSTIVAAAGFEGSVALEPVVRLSGVGPQGTPVSLLPRGTASESTVPQPGSGPGWLGLALGLLLFAAPVAWRWRS